ncbi:MAG: SDR family oxidoreductase [Chlorobia bacterium]|nr:SDR family oxidoreductase [Fimbriimonadaceae bacterium]
MKTILVAGGAGEVGEGIVKQLLSRGHRVLVQSRSADKIDSLKQRLGNPENLHLVVGEIGSESQIADLKEAVKSSGFELDSVVASIGSWWSGPKLIDLDLTTFNDVMAERLTTHFLVAKAFLSDLQDRPGSSYVFIHGASGFIPIPNSGPVSIAGAAQVMLKNVFVKELEGKQVRINLLSMMSSIATRSHPNADTEALTSTDVGDYVGVLVERAEISGQTIKFTHRREIPS